MFFIYRYINYIYKLYNTWYIYTYVYIHIYNIIHICYIYIKFVNVYIKIHICILIGNCLSKVWNSILKSPGDLFKIPLPSHPTAIKSDPLGWNPDITIFIKLAGWFQWTAKIENHWLRNLIVEQNIYNSTL